MAKRYFEFTEGTSNKFWEVWKEGTQVFTRYGKIGSDGSTTVKDEGSPEKAQKLYDKLVKEKTGKGYEEQSAGGDEDEDEDTHGAADFVDGDDDDDDDDDEAEPPPAATGTSGARYFEFVEGTSSKFWEVRTDGSEVFTRYGKIGTAGSTTVKDEGSPEKAQKLYDKLVKEKTGKGYEEKTAGGAPAAAAPAANKAARANKATDYKARWADIVDKTGPALVAALDQEWQFLVDTPKCKPALSNLLAKAKSAELDIEERLVVRFDNQYDGETTVTCSPPATTDLTAFPTSWQKFMQRYDGMIFDHDLDVPSSFNGTSGSGGFERDYLEEADPDLFEKLEDSGKDLHVPIDLGQDWVVAHPFKTNKLGEPALYFFSHEGGGLEDAYPGDLGLTGVFLCLMAEGITGKSFMQTETSGGDEDEDEDDGDDASAGARRFEFTEDGSAKFWEIRVEGSAHTVRYGKIGSEGQTKTKDFGSAALAQKDADKLIAEKTKKGYEEV